jgi:hypothetical protein
MPTAQRSRVHELIDDGLMAPGRGDFAAWLAACLGDQDWASALGMPVASPAH